MRRAGVSRAVTPSIAAPSESRRPPGFKAGPRPPPGPCPILTPPVSSETRCWGANWLSAAPSGGSSTSKACRSTRWESSTSPCGTCRAGSRASRSTPCWARNERKPRHTRPPASTWATPANTPNMPWRAKRKESTGARSTPISNGVQAAMASSMLDSRIGIWPFIGPSVRRWGRIIRAWPTTSARTPMMRPFGSGGCSTTSGTSGTNLPCPKAKTGRKNTGTWPAS